MDNKAQGYSADVLEKMLLATGARLTQAEADIAARDRLIGRLVEALEKIAYDDDVVYVACSDIPHCTGHPHNDECAVGIARAAIAEAHALTGKQEPNRPAPESAEA